MRKDHDHTALLKLLAASRHALHAGRLAEAKAVLRRAMGLSISKNRHRVWNALGNVFRAERQYGKAAAFYQRAINASPGRGLYWSNLSAALAGASTWSEAAKAASKAHRLLAGKREFEPLLRQLKKEIAGYRSFRSRRQTH